MMPPRPPRAHPLLALATLLLVAPAFPSSLAQSAVTGPEWFGPKGVDEGWHMRVDLRVTNPYGTPMDALPVAAELDLASLLLDAGWSGFDAGSGPVLSGFTLDFDSLRVVQVSSLGNFQGVGSSEGRILAEVPAVTMPGLLGRTSDAEEAGRPFDAKGNPSVTVFFRVPATLGAGQTAFFQVYFDSLESGTKSPPQFDEEASAAVEALHWHGTGVRLYGTVASRAGLPNQATVLAPFEGTQVTVTRLAQGAFVGTGVDLGGGSNRRTLAAGESVVAQLGPQANPVFRVQADKPVLAFAEPQGFVPAIDGGLMGTRFLLGTASTADGGAVYLINPGTAEAEVTVRTQDGVVETYQVPGGFYGGSNLECAPGGTWAPLPPGKTLTIDVESGGPLLVQLQPRASQQVPSVHGSPTGTKFLATALWSGATECGIGQGQRLLAGPLASSTTLRAETPETGAQLYPRLGANAPLDEPPALTAFIVPVNDPDARDRPILFEANQPIRLFAGGTPKNGVPSSPAGPLGGSQAGREFLVPGEALVIALYPETRVQGDLHFLDATTSLDEILGQDNVLLLESDEAHGTLQTTDLKASKPVLVYPRGSSASYLGGVPGWAETSVGPLAYRGRLLDLSGPNGEDPLQVSLKGGVETAIPLLVTNRGRAAVGTEAPSENVRLELLSTPTGWTARFDRPELPLAPGQSASVNLRVTPGLNGNDANVVLALVARSSDRPSVSDALIINAFQKSTYGVGIWFVQADIGPKTLQQDLAPGDTHRYPVVVKNLGGQVDTIRLVIDTPGANDRVQLQTVEGLPVDGVLLNPGQARRLDIVATAGDATAGLFVTTLVAQSDTASAVRDRVTAVTRVRVAADLVITAQDPYQLVSDGRESLFRFTLSNLANGSSDVRLGLLSNAPSSWPPSAVFAIDSTSGARIPVSATALDAGQTLQLLANVTVPPRTPAGTLVAIRLTATAGSIYVEGTGLGVVASRHDVVARFEPDLPVAPPGTLLVVDLVLRNLGNLNETLRIVGGALPAGWRLAEAAVNVTQNGTGRVPLSFTVPPSAPAGRQPVSVRLVSSDATVALAHLNVTVPEVAGAEAAARSGLLAQPGQILPFVVPFRNDGNVPVRVTLAPAPSEPWAVVQNDTVVVVPGANVTLRAAWQVPRDAASGPGQHHVTLDMNPPSQTATALGMTLDVGRANLRFNATQSLLAPSGTLVRAVVANTGDRDASAISLRVLHGSRVVAEQEISRLSAGRQADLLIALGEVIEAPLDVVIDPADAIVETDETDNRALLAAQVQEAPGLGLVVVVALAAMAVMMRRRKT